MKDIVKKVQNEKFQITIWGSESESPREWDYITEFRFKHKRYDMPDEIDENITDDMLFRMADKPRSNDKYIAVKVYMYDHSGVSFSLSSFNCKFDSGIIGFILVNKEIWKKEYNCKTVQRKKVMERISQELTIYEDYVNGYIFGFTIENNKGEEIENLGGFLGADYADAIIGNISTEFRNEINELIEQL